MKTNKATKKTAPQQIVIADRGWVWVGNVKRNTCSLTITNARTIRYWGTTRGLGELSENGPTPTTKLDPIGTVTVPMRAVIAIVACNNVW